MNISNSQVNRLRHFVRAGLRSLFRPEPQTAVEWADANYYLPKESAYQEGRWETLPFQRAIMNAMGSDYIREVNVVKSARVGYMGTSATMTSGEQSGAVIRGVFDDPENISYAGQGVRVEGSSPSLFVRTDEVRQLRRGDTLTIGEENFWVDRVSPDDGGSCHLWLGRGVPPAVNRRR